MNDDILVTRPSLPDFDEYVQEISSIWETKWLTNFGPKYEELKRLLSERFDYKYVDLQCNGHMTLQSIFSTVPTGEVITTPFTFASTTLALTNTGHTPVFCDINSYDYTIDVNKIEELITENTVAIAPVHVYGTPCDVEKIQKIADEYHLKVIYDAAHAFGVKINGIDIGNFGDASMFSFHATKVFNTVEGGMAVLRNEEALKKCKISSNFGLDCGQISEPGWNSKMSEFAAAMGIVNLRHFDMSIKKRKKIVEIYDSELSNISSLILNKRRENIQYNYAYYPIVFTGEYEGKVGEIQLEFNEKRIYPRRYFYPLVSHMPLYKDDVKTPVAEGIAENVLCLPLYPDMSENDIERVCNVLKETCS